MTVIPYATKHRWRRLVNQSAKEIFGKNNAEKIRSSLKRIADTPVRTEISPLDEKSIAWFEPLYTETISQKQNAKLHNLRETTIDSTSSFPFFILTLYSGDTPIGGTIFSERDDMLAIAYRIQPNAWEEESLPANPSIFSEYILNQHAQSLGKMYVSHGVDRNPYGLNANIGLAQFKLRVGCFPLLTKDCESRELAIEEQTDNILVLELPEKGEERIRCAHLVVREEEKDVYTMLTKFPERLEIITHLRS